MIRRDAWVAYAAAVWALIFAAFHVIWACGWYVGLDQAQARVAFRKPLFYAYDLAVVVMCTLGAVIALAAVSAWGACLPQRSMRIIAWTGTALLVLRAVASLVQQGYLLAAGKFTLQAVGIWEPWFCLGAALFAVNTWRHWRRPGRDG